MIKTKKTYMQKYQKNLALFPTCFATNIFAKKKKEMEFLPSTKKPNQKKIFLDQLQQFNLVR